MAEQKTQNIKFASQMNIAGKAQAVRSWVFDVSGRFGTWLFPARDEQTDEQENAFLQGLLQFVLWVAFAAFLFASLPHVAYFFASFEPEDAQGNVSDYWWVIAYVIAVSIDVTSYLLSMSIANKMRRATRGLGFIQRLGVGAGVAITHWPFILALVGFSWLVNFEHATQFHSAMLDVAEQVKINLIVWQGSLRDLNPVIASAFPVLAVAYTGMADDVKANKKKANTPNAASANTQGEQVTMQQVLEVIATVNEQHARSIEHLTRTVTAIEQSVRSLPTGEHPQIEAPRKRTPQTNTANTSNANTSNTDKIYMITDEMIASAQSKQKKEQARTLIMNNPNIKGRAIARSLDVAPSTAHKWKMEIEADLRANGLLGRTIDSNQGEHPAIAAQDEKKEVL